MENRPFISVILPIRNEADSIEAVLNAVIEQTWPSDRMEILVVDGLSVDGTREAIETLITNRAAAEPAIRLIDNPAKIVPTAMNLGIREAKGEVIVRIDGHAVVDKGYVEQTVDGLFANDADCVGGIVESLGDTYMGEAIAIAMSSRFGVGGASFRTIKGETEPKIVDTVPFGTFRRDVFERIGLFDEQFIRHQDYQLNHRLRAAGGKIVLLPYVKTEYYVRPSLKRLLKQYWQYGVWKGRFLRCDPKSLKLRHLIPPLFVMTVLLSALLGLFHPFGIWALTAALAAYAAFIVLALVDMARKGYWKYLPVMPIVLAAMHWSWGAGIWYGLTLPKLK